MAGEYLEKQKCKTNQRNQNLPTASHLAVELDGIVGNITYSLKLKKRNVLWGQFSCFSCCQAILTEIELLLINPKDTIGCSCLKQGLSLTFGRSQWEERKMQLRERENRQIGEQSRGPEVRCFQRPCTWGLSLSSCGHLCIRFDCRVLAGFLCDLLKAGHTKVRRILGAWLSQCHAAISD